MIELTTRHARKCHHTMIPALNGYKVSLISATVYIILNVLKYFSRAQMLLFDWFVPVVLLHSVICLVVLRKEINLIIW